MLWANSFFKIGQSVCGNFTETLLATHFVYLDPITETEVSLLESVLLGNMNIDCPSFRHQILSSLQAWLSRMAYYFKYSILLSVSLHFDLSKYNLYNSKYICISQI